MSEDLFGGGTKTGFSTQEILFISRKLGEWGIAIADINTLLARSAGSCDDFSQGDAISPETIERCLAVYQIWRALGSIFSADVGAQERWLNSTNLAPIFGGSTAIALMLSGKDGLHATKEYLEYHAYNGW